MPKVRLSAAVTLVVVGGLAGCRQRPEEAAVPTAAAAEERAERDGVPVSGAPLANHHYSPFYGGYVPFFVPIGGYAGGMSYRSHYGSLPPDQRSAYPPPRVGPGGSGVAGGRSGYSGRPSTSTGWPSDGVSRGGFGSTGRSGFSASS